MPDTPDELADARRHHRAGRRPLRRDARRSTRRGATRSSHAVGEGRPLLGICLGMQWLFEGSDEAPELPGLGLLSGRCYRLAPVRRSATAPSDQGAARRLERARDPARRRRSSTASPTGAQVYFTHCYAAPVTGDTRRGRPSTASAFAAVVQRGHIAGVQFHPEKSGDVGLQILRNFRGAGRMSGARLIPCCPSASSPASTSATARSSRA